MDEMSDILLRGLHKFRSPNGVEVYMLPLCEGEGSRSERECAAERALVDYLYGENARLMHRETGAPYVENGEGQEMAVSISHSKRTLCFARNTKRVGLFAPSVGVDAEVVGERIFRLKDKYLSASEQEQMELTQQSLTLCWCAKEAIYKIAGKEAGFMGEQIVLHTGEIDGDSPFTAYCKGRRYCVVPIRMDDEEVVVVATCLNDYRDLLRCEHEQRRHHLAVLLDPDKTPMADIDVLCGYIREGKVSFVLVGGSGYEADIVPFVECLQEHLKEVPVLLFPGSPKQLTSSADAMLLLSLISGREPQFLIGQHVEAVPHFRKEILETISTGYILVDGGKKSSVERVSGTMPLQGRQEVVDTACAGGLLGMDVIYLEAGSGALRSVDADCIKAVRNAIDMPLIVGGGIHTRAQMAAAFAAGADIVVIGNYFEQHPEDIITFGRTLNEE